MATPAPAPPPPGVAALPTTNRGLLTIGVMLATIMQILDSTIANVALPHMQPALGATADTVTWVLTSYIVASAIAIPITGWLSDRIGSRNLFLWSVVGFVASSALCGMAQNLEQMVAFRVLQGISAAFMNPLSQTVMLDINPPERQGKAMAIWGMGIMVGPILGPVIGGWLTENYDWRWVFYVNLPLGVFCFAVLWWLLPSRPVRVRPFDVLGFSLLAIGIGALQLMLDRGQTEDWFSSGEVVVEAVLAFIALWMFIVHLATGKRPMFDRDLFRNRNLVTGLAFMLVVGVVMMATMALLPPMLQRIYGYPVVDTGLLLMPRGIGVVFSMFVAAQLTQRGFDPRILVGVGFAVAAASLYEMTTWTLVMGAQAFVVSGLIQGLGLGLVFMPLNQMAFATLPPHYRTEASSLMNLMRNIGASVGISVVTALLARNIQTSHADLAAHVTGDALNSVDLSMLQRFGIAADAALTMIDAEVNRQAAMIAYIDDFWAMAIVTALSVPLVLFLKKPPKPVPGEKAAPVDLH
ncbi:disulfide bond formation protein DsbA [Sphingomonas sp. Leaf33]|uniref:DHA2 family efflux MFS transporter permease subunit n=1 Tax=Sphingomonas sp. Leaf33 TaxID=1736215 RepID=UPI0006FFD6C2|nr:DHA2 family efflux MFS transporter permease subunit [Sphingomonas sp. Leaf33]KQN26477.1 disulfide bond formation protein DsbA [Sphingomonas sp. Leaf33]